MYHLFALIVFPCATLAISCDSRFYCKTDEAKYVSMNQIPKTYLNATVLKKYTVKEMSACQQFCIRAEKCQSLNLNMSKTKEFECQILDANIYSNSSLLLTNDNFTHLFILNKCSKNPCKNGGICVPIYANDSYHCECHANATWISKGKHCEAILSGFATAFIYWSFENMQKKTPSTSSTIDASKFAITWEGISEPGRHGHVGVCRAQSSTCVSISSNLAVPCITNYQLCGSKVTYSIWAKVPKAQNGKRANILKNLDNHQGLYFFALDKVAFRFEISLITSKRWNIAYFGDDIDRTRWNQFTFTVDDSAGVCAFVNGRKNKCQTTSVSASLTAKENVELKIGGAWNSYSEPFLFFDDFAVWQAVLTDDEVMAIYGQSK